MKTSNRLLFLCMLVTMALMVNACSQTTQATDAPAQTDEETSVPADTEEEMAEVVELVYQRYAEGHDIELDFIEEFNAAHPGINVTVDTVPAGEAHSKVILTSEAGTPPDVYMSHFVISAATTGLAEDLDPFIDAEGSGWREGYSDSGYIFHRYAGTQYGMPWRVAPSIVFLNNTLLEKAGLEVPTEWTWDDFLAYAEAMTNPEEDEYGFCLVGSADNTTTTYQFGSFVFQAGGAHIGNDGMANMNSPEGVEALQFLVDMVHDDPVVPPGTASSTTNTCIDLLAADKVGMWTNASLWRGILRNIYDGIDISIAPAPSHATTGVWIGGTGFAMSPGSEHKEEAWEFMKWHLSEDVMRRWTNALGFMPANISLWEDPDYIAEDPEREIVANVSRTQDMFALDGYPEGFDLNGILRNFVQAAYILEMTPQEAMDAAAAEWNTILADYQGDDWWDDWKR